MLIKEIDFQNKEEIKRISVFQDISQGVCGGYVVRNFFDMDSLAMLKEIFENYPHDYFRPYDGFESLPRPFNFIFRTEKTDWNRECDYMYKSLAQRGIFEKFKSQMRDLVGDTHLIFSSPEQTQSFSNSWSSLRRLAPNKGMFEIHCGRLFQNDNTTFYNYFRNIADVNMQMVFLMIVDKPQVVESDIDIYEAHWEEYGVKIDENTLARNDGTRHVLEDIPVHRVQLRPGDILFFDEGNYWHAVPEFSGDKGRISFGGFATKYKHENTVQFWV